VRPHILCFSLDIVGVTKSRKITGVERVAHMTNERSEFEILVGKVARKPEGRVLDSR
jgi:hypothetical protein